ncbi:carbon monoxide dehydrogenase [Sulfolobales archaeon HS-7]|nr:carbon monoxide dehydrogenase [Sulfolobales archaeon HS-7]
MNFEGKNEVKVEINKLWDFLTQPEKVSQCFPGIKSISKEGEQYKVSGRVGIGLLKGDYSATFKYSDVTPLQRLSLVARGNGMGGTIDLNAVLELSGNNPVIVSWKADLRIGGTLASLGARVMNSAAGSIIEDLFNCIAQKVQES